MGKMNILVACEESQAVTIELRKLGHNAFSCDIIECSGGHPEWHIMGDVLPLLNGFCCFRTQNNLKEEINSKWDMIIAFPPCTHLAVSGARHFEQKRNDGRQIEAIKFFSKFLSADCEKICIENPVGIISGKYIKKFFPDICAKENLPRQCTQKIQPYDFGHKAKKTTCLWLKGLPKLNATEKVEPELISYKCKSGKTATFSKDYGPGGGKNGGRRSKTYAGIAKAMAEQWCGLVE